MPLVKPNYPKTNNQVKQLEPGRYTVRVIDAAESDHLDRSGNNALVVKMEVINCKNTNLNGKRISKWLPLGGVGSKVLYRFMKCLDESYVGQPFTTESLVGRELEVEVSIEVSTKDGKEWTKVDKMFPYLKPGSVATTYNGNANTTAEFDSFDRV